MRQETTQDQTIKLLELGFPPILDRYNTYRCYSIGELIEFLPETILDEGITYSRVIDVTDVAYYSWESEIYWGSNCIFQEKELVDSLFMACVKLKEEGKIVFINLKVNEAIHGMIKDDVHRMQRNYRHFQWMVDLLCQFDNVSKNPRVVCCQDDMDTCQGTPNFPKGKYAVNIGKKEYLGFIYDEFVKVPEDGYYAYDFALVNNGKVIAIGNEQGRCGGVLNSCRDNDFEDCLKKSPVYEKVNHLPIATEDELEEPIYMYFNNYKEYEEYMTKIKADGNK